MTNHWSGKHHRVVRGINLITLLWTDGKKLVPTDYRIYDKPFGGKTKNEYFGDMLYAARERGSTRTALYSIAGILAWITSGSSGRWAGGGSQG